jgi:hypothetical protein
MFVFTARTPRAAYCLSRTRVNFLAFYFTATRDAARVLLLRKADPGVELVDSRDDR